MIRSYNHLDKLILGDFGAGSIRAMARLGLMLRRTWSIHVAMKTIILSLALGLAAVGVVTYLFLVDSEAETAPLHVKRGGRPSKAVPEMERFRRCAAGLAKDCAGADGAVAKMFDEDAGGGDEVAPTKQGGRGYKDAARSERHEFLPFDPASTRIALEQATLDGACRRGNKRSCATLKKLSGSTQTLRKLIGSTKTDCARRRLEACRIRGDIAWAAGELEEARTWYDKGNLIARGESERCAHGKLRDAKRCSEAAAAMAHFEQRAAELSRRMLPAH